MSQDMCMMQQCRSCWIIYSQRALQSHNANMGPYSGTAPSSNRPSGHHDQQGVRPPVCNPAAWEPAHARTGMSAGSPKSTPPAYARAGRAAAPAPRPGRLLSSWLQVTAPIASVDPLTARSIMPAAPELWMAMVGRRGARNCAGVQDAMFGAACKVTAALEGEWDSAGG